MSNVINLFTREYLNIEPQYHNNAYSEAINNLARRWETTCNKVTITPKINPVDGILSVRTYAGNIHTGKINHGLIGNSMPVPVRNADRFWGSILRGNAYEIILEDECFQWMDVKYKVTLNFLEDLIKYEVPVKSILIRTRSDLFSHDQYLYLFKILKNRGVGIEFKLYGMNISEAENKRKWPGAPSVKRRQRALDKAMRELNLNNNILKSV